MTKARDLANASSALSAVSATELGYVDGVTSAIQTQLDSKVSTAGGSTITVASGTSVPLTIQNNGTGNSFIINDEATDTTNLIVDNSGNVGIGGAPTANAKLDVFGTNSRIRWENITTTASEVATNLAANAYVAKASDAASHSFKVSGTEKMLLDSSGNVGIGTSSPAAKLDVNGSFNATNYFVAGKNKIINGDFGIWQRGTSFSVNNASVYTADRWYIGGSNAVTISQQAFTAGTAPVAGYEGTYFCRFNRTSRPTIYDDYFLQRIEDVRTFAGQTVTLSFWAKTNTGTTTLSGAYIEQWFGSGGSTNVYVNTSGALTLTTSWQRFTTTMTMPSIAGKTIGAGSFVAVNFAMANAVGTSAVYDIWGVQLEAGSVATPFTTATGTIQGELAACQRYYQRYKADSVFDDLGYSGKAVNSTEIYGSRIPFVPFRVGPTSVDFANVTYIPSWGAGTTAVSNIAIAQYSSADSTLLVFTTTGVSTGTIYYLLAGNTTNAYIGLSAEL